MERHRKINFIILTICGLLLVACTYNLDSKDVVYIKKNFSALVSMYMIQGQDNSVETTANVSGRIASEPGSSTTRNTPDRVTYSPDGAAPATNGTTLATDGSAIHIERGTSPSDEVLLGSDTSSPSDDILPTIDRNTSSSDGDGSPADGIISSADGIIVTDADTHTSAADLWKAITLPPAMDSTSYATSKEYTDALYQEALSFFENTPLSLPWNSVLCIGDSITLGVQAGIEEGFWPISYPQIMSDLYGIYVDNKGVGGATVWKNGPYTLYAKMITCSEHADAVFFMGGLNDWFFGKECPIGDLDTPDTFTYDLNILFQNAKEMYTDADIFVIIPMNPAEHAGVEEYDNFDVIRNTERTLAAAYGFHIIDLPAQNLLSALDPAVQEAYYSDICHLNTRGYEILGTLISYDAIRIMCEAQQQISP